MLSPDQNIFPEIPQTQSFIDGVLSEHSKALNDRNVAHNLGLLYTPPRKEAVSVYGEFLKYNPNHLGNWSIDNAHPYATEVLEQAIVEVMIELYGGHVDYFSGYITSGATEGNLYMGWLARTMLEKELSVSQLCMVGTSLSHYSITKTAKVLGVGYVNTPLCRKTWSISAPALRDTIVKQYTQGRRGFIIPLTLGYTLTGTSDLVDEVGVVLAELSTNLSGVSFFVWIDAALDGLTFPFRDEDIKPLTTACVKGIVVDFHKYAGVPYSAGLVLYNSKLSAFINAEIPYLSQTDATLLGSRQGAVVPAVWAVIQTLGKEGFKAMVAEGLSLKFDFITAIKRFFPEAVIVTGDNSITCAVLFSVDVAWSLPDWFEKKYWLIGKSATYAFDDGTSPALRLYKFYFLPHVTKGVLEECIHDLSRLRG